MHIIKRITEVKNIIIARLVRIAEPVYIKHMYIILKQMKLRQILVRMSMGQLSILLAGNQLHIIRLTV